MLKYKLVQYDEHTDLGAGKETVGLFSTKAEAEQKKQYWSQLNRDDPKIHYEIITVEVRVI